MSVHLQKRGLSALDVIMFLIIGLVVLVTLIIAYIQFHNKGTGVLSDTGNRVISDLNQTSFLSVDQLSPERIASIENNRRELQEAALLTKVSNLLAIKQCERAAQILSHEMSSLSEKASAVYKSKLNDLQQELTSCRSQAQTAKKLQDIATLRQSDPTQATQQLTALLTACTSPTVECADIAAEYIFASLLELEKQPGFSLESYVKKTFFKDHALAYAFHTLVLGGVYTNQRLYDKAHKTYLTFLDPVKNPAYRQDDSFFLAALDRLDTLPGLSADLKREQFDLYIHLWDAEHGTLGFDETGQLEDTATNKVVSPSAFSNEQRQLSRYLTKVNELTKERYATSFTFFFKFEGTVNDDDAINFDFDGEYPFLYTSGRIEVQLTTPKADIPPVYITKEHVKQKEPDFDDGLASLEETESIELSLAIYDYFGSVVCSLDSYRTTNALENNKGASFSTTEFRTCGSYLTLRLKEWRDATSQGIPVYFSYETNYFRSPRP